MRRGVKVAIGIAGVVVLAAGVGGAMYGRRPKGIEVRTARAARKELISLVTANGTIQARTKVDLSANIMGQITQLNVEEGAAVHKGDLLLVIDPLRYGAVVDSRRAAVEALEAQLTRLREAAAQAGRELDRAEKQFKERILPEAEYDRVKSASEQASATVVATERQIAQGRAELAAARDELVKTEIRAPIDGIVTRRNVERGEVVVTGTMNNPGSVLMTISDMSVIEAVLEVDQTDVPQLRVGQPVSILIDAFPDAPFPGEVWVIGSSPIQGASALGGAATGTDYEVKVTLLSHPQGIRPGLTVTADITTATSKGVLTVPIGALVLRQEEEGGAQPPASGVDGADARRSQTPGQPASVASRAHDVEGIYVIAGGNAEFRRIATGIKGEIDVEVTEGLKEGEEIVVGPFKALRELKPGAAVVIASEKASEKET